MCVVYGVNCLTERTCHNLFKKFRSGDLSLKDDQRSGRLSEVDNDIMIAIIESNRHITVREIAKQLNLSHTRIENHIRRIELIKKLDIWTNIWHELKEIHLTQRINV